MRVRAVVVNYEGGETTLKCLHHLSETARPSDDLEIVLIDNDSHDDVVDRVRSTMPEVRVIRSPTNRGFAGGCNLGMRDLDDVDAVALVNSDAFVETSWLAPLVDALRTDPRAGAAVPKIRLAGPFQLVEIDAPTHRPGRGDRRALGVRVSGVQIDGDDRWSRTRGIVGTYEPEPEATSGGRLARWTGAHATLAVPAATHEKLAMFRLAAESATTIVATSGRTRSTLSITPEPTWFPVQLDSMPVELLHNTGTVLTADGFGADRGYLEPDDGRYAEDRDVFAWCGAAVLLRREYLDDVGLFDERLFLYYEDFELSWRGIDRGWRHVYVPDSVVSHLHAASSGEGTSMQRYYNERNRLLVLTRHAPWGRLLRALWQYFAVTASYAVRDLLSPMLHGRAARPGVVGDRVRAGFAYLRTAPAMLMARGRRRSERRRTSSTADRA